MQMVCRGELEFAVVNPFEAGNVRCYLPQASRPPPKEDNFKTIVVINMHVCGRYDRMVVIVLNSCQAIFQFTLMVIIHQS